MCRVLRPLIGLYPEGQVMSEVSNSTNDVKVETEEKKEELVSQRVVDEYKNDMFKYKAKMRETEAELQKLKDNSTLLEKQSLEEKEEWKLLYEREKEEKSRALGELEQKSSFFIDTSKKNAVVLQLGGFKKSSYVSFVNPASIEVKEDGTFDEDSITREVDRIKQEFPELIKAASSPGKMPNEAATNFSNSSQDKKLNTLSGQELLDLYAKVNKN